MSLGRTLFMVLAREDEQRWEREAQPRNRDCGRFNQERDRVIADT
jgi:hypothetical protein